MIMTHDVLDDRKNEIEFYYSIMVDIDNNYNAILRTKDNQRFFRIMKSNFLLMLYNLIEATITTGMLEIYDSLKDEKCSYANVIDEIQNIWRNYKIQEIYRADSGLSTYTKRVQKVVLDITQNVPLDLSKNMIGISGNLDAAQIKTICDKHRIRYRVIDDHLTLDKVKKKRNSLAHGDESFSVCARDLTCSDLRIIKDTVISFISGIVAGMEKYCDEKQYLRK